ncbi:hypothetical protein GLYMA_20G055867v4 [Glycine max]|nr:hypothetical protein GLYMA_20G055867v4 [Glycine max]KAH1034711.1 hypothetical protein GYH30_054906 [Glycine max]
MNVKATVLFVVFASCFLFMLYKLMSSWFIDVLVVLFCIGGIEGLQTCLVALLSRWFKHAGESYIKVPFLGAISYLTLAVSPFCITFSILWAVYRNESFAWIGQDILVRINFSPVLNDIPLLQTYHIGTQGLKDVCPFLCYFQRGRGYISHNVVVLYMHKL